MLQTVSQAKTSTSADLVPCGGTDTKYSFSSGTNKPVLARGPVGIFPITRSWSASISLNTLTNTPRIMIFAENWVRSAHGRAVKLNESSCIGWPKRIIFKLESTPWDAVAREGRKHSSSDDTHFESPRYGLYWPLFRLSWGNISPGAVRAASVARTWAGSPAAFTEGSPHLQPSEASPVLLRVSSTPLHG